MAVDTLGVFVRRQRAALACILGVAAIAFIRIGRAALA
jgi:hypothetical protein